MDLLLQLKGCSGTPSYFFCSLLVLNIIKKFRNNINNKTDNNNSKCSCSNFSDSDSNSSHVDISQSGFACASLELPFPRPNVVLAPVVVQHFPHFHFHSQLFCRIVSGYHSEECLRFGIFAQQFHGVVRHCSCYILISCRLFHNDQLFRACCTSRFGQHICCRGAFLKATAIAHGWLLRITLCRITLSMVAFDRICVPGVTFAANRRQVHGWGNILVSDLNHWVLWYKVLVHW